MFSRDRGRSAGVFCLTARWDGPSAGAPSMTEDITPDGEGATSLPRVTTEDTTVLLYLNGAVHRCTADAAHALSDRLFQAALEVEQRLAELENRGGE